MSAWRSPKNTTNVCRSLIQVEKRALPTAPLCFPIYAKSNSFVTSVHEETGRCPINDSLIQSGEKSISTSSDVLFNLRKEHIIHEIRFVSMCRSVMDPRNCHSSRAERALPTAPPASLSMQSWWMSCCYPSKTLDLTLNST